VSERKHPNLVEAFGTTPFSNNDFIIGSSALIRAQQTAHLMIGKQSGMPVNVMPYLGEISKPRVPIVTPDNTPTSPDEQAARLEVLTKREFLKGFDKRESPYSPRLATFLEWAVKNQELFPLGPDGVRRAILFTHSNLLEEEFKKNAILNSQKNIQLEKNKLSNNDFLVTIYNPGKKSLAGKQFIAPEAVHPRWKYFDTRHESFLIPCGFETSRCQRIDLPGGQKVPITRPCNTSGGKRKTRRLPKGLLRLRRRCLSRRLQK
jgi:hypothetical protein